MELHRHVLHHLSRSLNLSRNIFLIAKRLQQRLIYKSIAEAVAMSLCRPFCPRHEACTQVKLMGAVKNSLGGLDKV